ncbi:MAG TPA: recombinase family protein [Ktedonobacteraceae bacterium]|nr:recombinase family protein [Ktedonobacteraceae bacterium]
MEHTLVVAGYVRNSDPSKKDTEVLNAQKEALRAYAKAVYGVDIPPYLMYEDAMSALKYDYWEREGLMKACDDAENRRFDILLCTEFFRIARKANEQAAVIQYFKRFNVEVISITEKFEDTAEGRLLHAVQGFLGEVEAEKTRIRTSRGKRHRATMALTGQGRRTYGLKWVDTKQYIKAYYVPNTDVIAVIDGKEWTEVDVLMFEKEQCLKGVSARQIAMRLTEMGIPTQQGNKDWNRGVVLQHLTNGNYRGYPYATNYRKARQESKNGKPSFRKTTPEEQIPLPEGIFPCLITPEEFEEIQMQLQRNKDMSPRNNRRPNDTLLRGLVFCGICARKMHSNRYTRRGYDAVDYQCKQNWGENSDLIHHHSVSISVANLDAAVWEFVLPYLETPTLIRENINGMREQADTGNRSLVLELQRAEIKDKIANLLAVAEDVRDETTRQLYRERLAKLEHDMRETEALLARLSNSTERNQKLLAALDKFEAWAVCQQDYLHDPDYEITKDDKRAVLMVLGVKVKVWPSEGYPQRTQFEISPPEIQRFCDFNFQ